MDFIISEAIQFLVESQGNKGTGIIWGGKDGIGNGGILGIIIGGMSGITGRNNVLFLGAGTNN
jgi:hypothetical protein